MFFYYLLAMFNHNAVEMRKMCTEMLQISKYLCVLHAIDLFHAIRTDFR